MSHALPRRLLPVALAAALLPAAARAAPADPSGTWFTEDGRARVRVEHCGPRQEQICGYVVWMKLPNDDEGRPRTDRFNPAPEKQTRPALGHQMILGLKPNADGQYAGRLYNGDNGKTYDVTFLREGPTDARVKGCVLSILCGSQAWTLVTDIVPGQLTGPTGGPGGPRPDREWAKEPAGTAGIKPRAQPAPQ